MKQQAAGKTTIELLEPAHAAELLQFEVANRAFFEESLPGRGDAYYSLENIRRTIHASLEERRQGQSYLYLVRNARGELVGRINLFDAAQGMAELGYRIGKRHQGQRHATQAVGLVVREAFETYKLHRLEAATSPQNIGSQLVLLKNGFQFWGRARRTLLVNGVWLDSVYFERHRNDADIDADNDADQVEA